MTVPMDRRDGHFRVLAAISHLVRQVGGVPPVADYLGISEKSVRRALSGETKLDSLEMVGLIVLERDDLGSHHLADVLNHIATGQHGEPGSIRAHLASTLKLLGRTTITGVDALEDGVVDLRETAATREAALAAIASLQQLVADCDAVRLRASVRDSSPH